MNNFLFIAKAIFKRGPRFLWVYFWDAIWFDIINGTHTHMRVPKEELSNATQVKKEGLLYVASFTSVITKTLQLVRQDLGEDEFSNCQFVDLGCGKGKTMLVYGKLFGGNAKAQPVGIEYEDSLCRIATANINKCLGQNSGVRVYCDSAQNLRLYIRSSSLLVYLYNSFQGETLREVLSELSKYPHSLIYVDPVERDYLEANGYVVIGSRKGHYNADTWVIYRYNIK